MTLSTVSTLLFIALVAVVSPVLSEITGRFAIPDVVFEIGLGIVIGPSLLNIAHVDSVISALSQMGLSFLMFLAGFELDLARVRGRPLRLATLGWMISLGMALLTALALVTLGTVLDAVVVGLALTTTALGTLLPILRDTGVLGGPFRRSHHGHRQRRGVRPILAVAILLDKRNAAVTGVLVLLFIAVAAAAAIVAARPYPPKFIALLHRHLQSSAQLPVRVSVVLVLGLVYLAFRLGLDVLLGAFAAGIVVRLLIRGEDAPIIKGKLEAIGFGFLIPIFFIVSGVQFDLTALTSRPIDLLRVPLFLVLFLVIRGVPAFLLYRRDVEKGHLAPLALFSRDGAAPRGGDHDDRGGGRTDAAGKRSGPGVGRDALGSHLPHAGESPLGRIPLPSAAAPALPTEHRPEGPERPELAPGLQPPLLATTDGTDTLLPPPSPRTTQTPNGAIDQGPGGGFTKEPT